MEGVKGESRTRVRTSPNFELLSYSNSLVVRLASSRTCELVEAGTQVSGRQQVLSEGKAVHAAGLANLRDARETLIAVEEN